MPEPPALTFPPTWTYDAYAETVRRVEAAYGQTIERLNALQWVLGDLLLAGERSFPDRYTQPLSDRFSPSHLKNLVRVAHAFPPAQRRADLSWSHHLAAAALPAPERSTLLERAAQERWTVTRLRAYLSPATPRPLPPLPGLLRAQQEAVRAFVESFYAHPPAQTDSIEIETDWGAVRISFTLGATEKPPE